MNKHHDLWMSGGRQRPLPGVTGELLGMEVWNLSVLGAPPYTQDFFFFWPVLFVPRLTAS